MKMNAQERVDLLFSMDTVVRSLNDELCIETWLAEGVPDGTEYADLIDYTDDETFADIMDTFVCVMAFATTGKKVSSEKRKAVLYCDGVISENLELFDKEEN